KLDAGAIGPWHYHPGPAIIIVEEGEFTLTQDNSDCATVTYVAEPGGNHPVVWEEAFNIHRPANLSDKDTTIYITFLDIPRDSPDMIAANPQVCNQNSVSLSGPAKTVVSAKTSPHQMQDAGTKSHVGTIIMQTGTEARAGATTGAERGQNK